MNKKNNKVSISLSVDLSNNYISSHIFGENINNSEPNEAIANIAENIKKSLNQFFRNRANEQAQKFEEFKNYIDAQKFEKAYELFEQYHFLNFDELFNYLEKFEYNVFNDKNKVATVFLAKCKIKEERKEFGYVAHQIPIFLDKYEGLIENKQIVDEFKYARTYANYKLGNKEVATILSDDLLKNKDIKKNIKRRIYLLKSELEQNLQYLEIASDIALEEGDINEVVALKMNLADKMMKIDVNKTISIIESLEELINANNINDDLLSAKILFNKANYLFHIKDFETALSKVEEAIAIINKFAGDDINSSRHTYCCLALQIAKNIQNEDKIKKYEDEVKKLRTKLNNKEYINQLNILPLIENKKFDDLCKLKETYLKEKNYYIVYIINTAIATFSDFAFDKKIALLDEVENFKNNIPLRDTDNASLYHLYAHLFLKEEKYQKFIQFALKSLNLNIYNCELRNNYIAVLLNESRWQQLEEFTSKCLSRFGELPNYTFLNTKAICKQNIKGDKLNKAISNLANIIPNLQEDLQKEATALILEQAKNGAFPQNKYDYESIVQKAEVTRTDFETALADFKRNVEQKIRMSFWKYNKEEEDKHEYVDFPETLAKTNFITFMNSRFVDNVKIIDECTAGAGFIDVYLIFKTFTVVVELKMCGHGYSSTYALSGKEQLKHYLDNSDSRLAYLLVFDSRIKDFNKYMSEKIDDKEYTIITNAIDIRPIVK